MWWMIFTSLRFYTKEISLTEGKEWGNQCVPVMPQDLLAQITCGSTNMTQKIKPKLLSSKLVVPYMPKITHANFRCRMGSLQTPPLINPCILARVHNQSRISRKFQVEPNKKKDFNSFLESTISFLLEIMLCSSTQKANMSWLSITYRL